VNVSLCLVGTKGKNDICHVFLSYLLYMLKVLKQLLHVTCRTHCLSTVAEQLQGDFPEVNNLISSTMNVFVKQRSETRKGFWRGPLRKRND
jgi:hypothetical protein